MAQFIGRYEHTLDVKGRLILPAKFRPPFERGGYLSQYHEGCLALWTPEEFERQLQSRQSEAERGREERNLVRVWAGGSSEVEMDKSGRMPIPGYLRTFAGLEPSAAREPAPVLVIGAIDRVELWSPAAWEAKVAPSERALMDA
ncbi:MAG TPA: division/cell wall cluster transcriptional repressor MraZ [Acidimicrobiales bacterium]|nr:division/cell wall cluster transcriptional repressor MraZ [Acidimicrobiales bacterium]